MIYASGDPTSAYTMLYVWVALYAFYGQGTRPVTVSLGIASFPPSRGSLEFLARGAARR